MQPSHTEATFEHSQPPATVSVCNQRLAGADSCTTQHLVSTVPLSHEDVHGANEISNEQDFCINQVPPLKKSRFFDERGSESHIAARMRNWIHLGTSDRK